MEDQNGKNRGALRLSSYENYRILNLGSLNLGSLNLGSLNLGSGDRPNFTFLRFTSEQSAIWKDFRERQNRERQNANP
jgi:hypothetical protein